MIWYNSAIGIGVALLAILIYIELRRWQNKRDAKNKVLLEILPPTGQEYYALATKDEKRLTVKSPTVKGLKHTYFVDRQATWDSEYPMSDLSFTRVTIKKVIYKEGEKEPAVKRPSIVMADGKATEAYVEIANPTLVALTKDADDLVVIIRETNGSQGIFGANTNLVIIIVLAIILAIGGANTYYLYKIDKFLMPPPVATPAQGQK